MPEVDRPTARLRNLAALLPPIPDVWRIVRIERFALVVGSGYSVEKICRQRLHLRAVPALQDAEGICAAAGITPVCLSRSPARMRTTLPLGGIPDTLSTQCWKAILWKR